ncbi:MAG: anti-sigma factor domain-containing protein [Turicibacter sp.]
MYYKGVVVEILAHCAIILTKDGEFIKIKKCEQLEVGQTILCLPDDLIKPTPKVIPFYKKAIPMIATLAACLLLMLIPTFNQATTYAVLSVDVNPSFELELDDQMMIIGVKTLNQSAKKLKLTRLKGLPLEEGLTVLRDILIQHDIPLEQHAMLFSLALMMGDDIDYEDLVKQSLKVVNPSDEFAYLKISNEELEQAHQEKVSGAKLKAKQLLNGIDIDDLSVNEIIQLFNNHNIKFNMLLKNGIEIDDDDDLEDQLEDLLEGINEQSDDFQLDDEELNKIEDDDDDVSQTYENDDDDKSESYQTDDQPSVPQSNEDDDDQDDDNDQEDDYHQDNNDDDQDDDD